MSMTREEAVRYFDCIIRAEDFNSKQAEAARIALTALRGPTREMVERMRGEWVKPHWKNSTSCAVCSRCGFEAHHYEYRGVQHNYLFCPNCGAPMTDEAVDMMLERWKEAVDGEI